MNQATRSVFLQIVPALFILFVESARAVGQSGEIPSRFALMTRRSPLSLALLLVLRVQHSCVVVFVLLLEKEGRQGKQVEL